MADSLGKRPNVLLLGPMRLQAGSETTTVRGAKQRILLAHLVLSNGRPVPISRLVSDLWGDRPVKSAPHALQEHVSRLRTSLKADITLLEGAGYQLATDAVETDVQRFTQLYEQGRAQLAAGEAATALTTLEQAQEQWRGPFLDDLADVDGLRSHKLHLDQMWRQTRSDRIDAYLGCGRGSDVITEIRALLDQDPLKEHTWYQYIRALDQSGRRTKALQGFHDAREVFIDVLGVEPSERLNRLHTELLQADDFPAEPVPPSPTAATLEEVTRASSLVGRRYEVATLERIWRESRAGLHVVTLSGEPGVGKSRLAREFQAMAAAQGALVLRGDCQPSTTVAYQPFSQMLHASMDYAQQAGTAHNTGRHAVGLTRVLPQMASLFDTDSAAARDTRVGAEDVLSMDALAAWFEALSYSRPLVMVLEDLQWADEQSVLALQHLIRSTRNIRATLVVTIRDHEVVNASDSPTQIPHLLEQSTGVTHLTLPRLTPAETTELVSLEAGHTNAQSLPDWADSYVQASSGGNPLFTIELTRHLLATGALEDGTIPAPPAGLRQVIEGHVNTLDARASALLRRAAAFGSEFDPAYLTRVTDASAADVDAMLLSATTARLIEPATGSESRYAFSHDVVRAVLYESIPPLERAQLHANIAQAFVEPGTMSRAQHLQELAYHLRHSDTPNGQFLAAVHLKDAGEHALNTGAPAKAGALLSQALELLGDTADARVVCDVLLGLGAAQLRYADPEYRVTLLRAARLAMDLGDTDRLTRAVLTNSRGWWSASTQIDHERVDAIETALATCDPDDTASMSQLLGAWALENVRDPGSRQVALDRSARALELADELGDPEVLIPVLTARYAVMYALFEGPAECVTLARRLLELAQSQGNRMMVLSGLTTLGQASMRYGDYQVADRCIEHAQQLSRTLDHPPRRWLVDGWSAMREATRGRFDSAQELAAQTYELGAKTGQLDALTWYMGQVYTFALMQGQLGHIVPQLDEHVADVADAIPAWRAAMALALAHAGQRDKAEYMLADFAADNFDQLPQDILWLNGMSYLALTCELVGDEEVASALYERLAPYSGMVATNATIDAGPVDLHLGILATVLANREAAESHLTAAATLSRKVGSVVWLAEAQKRLVALSR